MREFELIDLIVRKISRGAPAPDRAVGVGGLVVGPGDDAAVLVGNDDYDLLLSCDTQTEGVHFRSAWLSMEDIGWRAVMAAASDMAAMGGKVLGVLLSLHLPPDGLDEAAASALIAGVLAALEACGGASMAGGNVSRAPALSLETTVFGRVPSGRAVLRSGARAGEVVMVTGQPGRAAAALEVLRRERVDSGDWASRLLQSYRRPRAQIEAGEYLMENAIASAMIDTSDGLLGDLEHLCESSGVGAVVFESALPVDSEIQAASDALGFDPLAWILGASDDYELLFTVPRSKADHALAMAGLLGIGVHPIGETTDRKEVFVRTREGEIRPAGGGWDHFAGAE